MPHFCHKHILPFILLLVLLVLCFYFHQFFGYLRVESHPYGLLLYHLDRCFLVALPLVLWHCKRPNDVALFIALVLFPFFIIFNFVFASVSLGLFVLAALFQRLRLILLPCSLGIALLCLPIFLFTLFGYQGEYENFETLKLDDGSSAEVRLAAVGNMGATTNPSLSLELVKPVLAGIYLHKTILVFDESIAQIKLAKIEGGRVKYFVSRFQGDKCSAFESREFSLHL